MYTQAMDIPDDSGKKLAAVSNAPSEQEAAFEARIDGARASFVGAGFALELDPVDPAGSVTGKAEGEVDLTYFHLMDMISAAVLEAADNYVSAAARA